MQYLILFEIAAAVFCGSFLLCLAIISHTILRRRKFRNTAIKKAMTVCITSIFIMMFNIIGYMNEGVQLYKDIVSKQCHDIDEYQTENDIYLENIYRLQDEGDELRETIKWQSERIQELEESK